MKTLKRRCPDLAQLHASIQKIRALALDSRSDRDPNIAAAIFSQTSTLLNLLQAGEECTCATPNLPDDIPAPTNREFVAASDNPHVLPYLAGIDAAVLLRAEIDTAELIGCTKRDQAIRAFALGLVDTLKTDDEEAVSELLDAVIHADEPFWGCNGVPELEQIDIEILDQLKQRESSDD